MAALLTFLTFLTVTCHLSAGQEVDDVTFMDGLVQELKVLDHDAKAANIKIEDLEAKITQYEEQLQQLQKEVTSSRTSCDVTITKLSDTLRQCLADNVELNTNVSHLNDDLFKQSSYTDNLEHEMEDCKIVLNETESSLELVASESVQCAGKLENTEISLQTLNNRYEKCNNDVNALQYEYHTLENTHNESKLQFGDAQFQLLETSSNANVNLRNCRNELEISNNKSVLLENTKSNLLMSLGTCNNELRSIQDDKDNCDKLLNACTSRLVENEISINRTVALKLNTEAQLENCMSNIRKSEEEKENILKNQTNLVAILSKCDSDKTNIVNEINQLKSNCNNEKDHLIEELQTRISSCSQDTEIKIIKINEVQGNFEQCEINKEHLNIEIGILQEKHDNCSLELENVNTNFISSENSLNICNNKFTSCKAEKGIYNSRINSLQTENRKCNNDIMTLNTAVQNSNAKYSSCNFDLEQMKSSLSSVQIENSNCWTTKQNCEQEMRKAYSRIGELQSDLNRHSKNVCERVKSGVRSVGDSVKNFFG